MNPTRYLQIIGGAVFLTWIVSCREMFYGMPFFSSNRLFIIGVASFLVGASVVRWQSMVFWVLSFLLLLFNASTFQSIAVLVGYCFISQPTLLWAGTSILALLFASWAVSQGLAVMVWGVCLILILPSLVVRGDRRQSAHIDRFAKAVSDAEMAIKKLNTSN